MPSASERRRNGPGRSERARLESPVASMADSKDEPTNTAILTALQGLWRQHKDLIQGVEGRLAEKIDAVEARLDSKLAAAEQRLGDRLAQELRDRAH